MKLKLYNEITIQDNKVVKVEKAKAKPNCLCSGQVLGIQERSFNNEFGGPQREENA
jgi:hypothetical protein